MSTLGQRAFSLFNKMFMVPMFRLGFGQFVGNPITGYIMVLRTVGRRSGKIRYTPVSYAIHEGNVYCMAGFGKRSDWYLNMIASRKVEAILPAGPLFGEVEDVSDAEERRLILRKILQNAGFAGFMEGLNPFTIKDADLIRKTAEMPLVRIRPVGVANGASDPQGWAWILMVISTILIILVIIALVR